MLRLDDLRIEPFDDGCIAQALRIIIQIVRHDSENVKAFLQLKTEVCPVAQGPSGSMFGTPPSLAGSMR